MILFLNFAPLDFAGGAERWMLDVSSAVSKKERVTLFDVHQSISNFYGKLVLKRLFSKRVDIKNNKNLQHTSLTFFSFIPFTKNWKSVKNVFKKSRIIYVRYELLEILIIFYFGGLRALRKTVAGMHSPFKYDSPMSFFDRFHNFVYTSTLSKKVLSYMNKIHVLTSTDEKLFTDNFHFSHVIRVPNYVRIKNGVNIKKTLDDKKLHIITVGELSIRKGTDILIDVIKKSPEHFVFHIAGDGVMKKEIEDLTVYRNVEYYGYLKKNELSRLYKICDVFFLPSRAESFSLATLEAMAHGLSVVSSSDTKIGLPRFIQSINAEKTSGKYVRIFEDLSRKKVEDKLLIRKKHVRKYTKNNFSKNVVIPQLIKRIFNFTYV